MHSCDTSEIPNNNRLKLKTIKVKIYKKLTIEYHLACKFLFSKNDAIFKP